MSDPTPHWQRLRRDHPEAHVALQRAAEALYEQTEEPVHVGGTEAGVRAATNLGLLESGDRGVSFADPEVRQDYLIRHVAGAALSAWEEPTRFADAIADAQRRTLRYSRRREMTAAVLLVLTREHDKDVVGRVAELARSKSDGASPSRSFWDLYSPFCEALPQLEVEPRALAEALEAVSEATANDGTAGFLYNAVEGLAARSWADGDALYGALLSRPDSLLVNFVPAVLVGLARTDMDEAHRRALQLSVVGEPAARRAGIAALGFFGYSSAADHGSLLEATWERLELGRMNPDPEVDHVLARAYGRLIDHRPEATEALVDLSTRQDPAVQGEVSSILFQKSDEAYDEQWFREALMSLAVVPTSYKGVVENLDHSLYRVASENPYLAVEFMEAMVVGRNYGENEEGATLPDMLPGAFAELIQHHPGALEEAVTRWFASSERRLHRAARDIVHATYDITSERQPWVKLSTAILNGLEEQVVFYALQRIMGHVLASRPLAALLLSATRRASCSPEFLGFVASALGSYVLRNFPHEAGAYLRERLDAVDVTEAEIEVAQAALRYSDAYLDALRGLPLLREFQPPSHRLYLKRLAEHRQQASMMDRAKQSSVLLNLMPELPLKYGRSHFMENDEVFTQPSELVPFSVSAEKPRAEILDPVGQMFQRVGWQSAGLREIEGAENEGSAKDQRDGEGRR